MFSAQTFGLAFCVAVQSVRTDYVAAHNDNVRGLVVATVNALGQC